MQDNAFENLYNADVYQKMAADASIEAVTSFKRKIISDISYAAKQGKRMVSFQIPIILTDAQVNNIIKELQDKGFKVKYTDWAEYELAISW